ncbi:tail length tape-measure protein [Enterococcus phage vb_GEC_Ef_S_9]|nr:tail length tape-measure protein [Enterococcus phage vb_GEC_Ef_S_9]
MLNAKEGQTYVCKRDKLAWWTLDKEYKVEASSNGLLYLTDDEGDNWYLPNDWLLNTMFKLKEQTFDLNKLTTAQLREYVDLLDDKEDSERLLNEFIERMSK